MDRIPSYRRLHEDGRLRERAMVAWKKLEDCVLCPRYCHANRLSGITGAWCRTGERARVHSYGPHLGEEDPLRGTKGSGTIFFSWCNLRCDFCQNWEISQRGVGREVEPEEISEMMLELQERGCHNINFVTPSHVVAQIIEAVSIAAGRGLILPLVYNTGGYDSPEALALLDGIIDVYMPDMKYADADIALRCSHAPDYPRINQAAVREMHRQVGNLEMDESGVAVRGLLVRHLVLPGGMAGTGEILTFLAREISQHTYVNLMDQYHPSCRAQDNPPLDRAVTLREFREATALAERHGLHRLDRRRARPGA